MIKKEIIKKAVEDLKACQGDFPDVEEVHSTADDILCQVLIKLKCKEIVDEYEKVEKWYG